MKIIICIFLLIPLLAYAEEPLIKNLPETSKLILKFLGGFNITSFCRLEGLDVWVQGDKIETKINGQSYAQCLDVVKNGRGMYGEKNYWKQAFAQKLSSPGGWAKDETKINKVFHVALEQAFCNLENMKKLPQKRISETVGEERDKYKKYLASLEESLDDYRSWYKLVEKKKFDLKNCPKEDN